MKTMQSLFTLVVIYLFSHPVFADENMWSSAAMACVPTAQTIAENKYVTTAGRVKFKDGYTGTISFVCPLTRSLKKGKYNLIMVAKLNGGSSVPSARLVEQRGSKYQITNLLVADNLIPSGFPSGHPSAGYDAYWSDKKEINIDIDGYNYYWVQLTINKQNEAGAGHAIEGVKLVRN
jgi:hypothetical protein